ncbi:cytochrome P450 [Melanogaster broomeanus]|nr:cytochrome P450 [Melanogaster broomeanus]
MDVTSTAVCCAGFALCLTVILRAWRKRTLRNGLPLPPGPKGLPLIGNVFDLNISEPWLSYEQWGKKYGDVVYSSLIGQDFVVLNSWKSAHELFDQRPAIYSDRARIPTTELVGMSFSSGLLPYGNKWRLHRQMFNIALSKQVIPQYRPMLMEKTHQLLENLLNSPEDYDLHFKTLSAAIIMAVTYGYDAVPTNDPIVTKVERFIELIKTVMSPEQAALFAAFPFVAHIPSWLPGGRYKQKAAECRRLAVDVVNDPFNYVKDQMASGTARKSLVKDLLEKENWKTDEETVKSVAATSFLGVPFQTGGTFLMFLLAMVLHPNVRTKAQQEIDRVVGSERLPNFDDRPNLPYVEAVFLETFRWRPAVPLALPHLTTTNDVYEGMYIPKGTLPLAIGHEEARFPDPMAFKPERHLTPTGSLAKNTPFEVYGFGRRICPAKNLADESVWIGIVSVLATLRVAKAQNEFGEEIDIKPEFTGGLTTCALLCGSTETY